MSVEKPVDRDGTEQLADDRVLAVAHDQRRDLAQFLLGHAQEITRSWRDRVVADETFAPPQTDLDASDAAELSLLALVEHLEAAGPDTHLPAHEAWLARWHETGSSRARGRDHFHALRDVAAEALQHTDEVPLPEKAALVGLLEAAVRNLRLETSEAETRHLLAEALAARRQFEGLFESSLSGVVIGDPAEGTALAANPAAAQLLELSREDLLHRTLADLLPDLPRVLREQLDPAHPLYEQPQVVHAQAPGDRVRVIEVVSAPVEYHGHRAAQIFLRDVTQRVRFHEELERRAAELQSQLSGRLQELEQLQVFMENVINALPARLLVLDENLVVLHANSAYLRQRRLEQDEVEGQHISEVFPHSLLEEAGLRQAMENTIRTGDRVRWAGFRQPTGDHAERILNIGLDPSPGTHGERNLVVTIEDVTERHRQLYERSILHQIIQAMLGVHDLPRLLHAILTGITAGGAVGLGFNRAILLLADEEHGVLKAEMAVGPENPTQAGQIWRELGDRHSLSEFLSAFDRLPPPEEQPLRSLVARLSFPLDETAVLPMLAAATRETVHVYDAADDPRVPHELYEILGADEFVVAPLVVQQKTIGVAIADNSINRQRIAQTDVQLLTALANHAALAIDSARVYAAEQRRADELDEAYRQLAAATDRLVRQEALAAIGEVAAVVAHEIRNPLSTVGGFAKMMLRPGAEVEMVKRNAAIIVDEVAKLEGILSDLLDFTKPSRPQFADCSLSAVVEASLQVARTRADRRSVQIQTHIPGDLPLVPMDSGQMQQVMTNLLLNAIDATPDDGRVAVRAWQEERLIRLSVSDTGQGIPASHLDQIFDTFFTTKPTGTGLGLALARKVIEDHGATIEVQSAEGVGTTFTIAFDLDYEIPPPLLAPELVRRQIYERGHANGQANDSGH